MQLTQPTDLLALLSATLIISVPLSSIAKSPVMPPKMPRERQQEVCSEQKAKQDKELREALPKMKRNAGCQPQYESISCALYLADVGGVYDYAQLKNFSSLRSLSLNKSFTDADMHFLANMHTLEKLYLLGCPVSDKGMQEIAGLKNLRELVLESTKIEGHTLSDFPNLETLTATTHEAKLYLDDLAIKQLAAAKKLKSLMVAGTTTRLTGAGLSALSGLERLSIEGSILKDSLGEELGGLKHLSKLVLSRTNFNGRGLGKLKCLEVLEIYSSPVDDRALAELAALPELSSLALNQTPVSDAGLRSLSTAASLKLLDLSSTRVSDAGLADLSELRTLRALDLSKTKITDAGLKSIVNLPALICLNLGNTKITDRGLEYLKQARALRELQLDHTSVSGQGVKHLQALKTLEKLSIRDTAVTKEALSDFEHTNPHCRSLWEAKMQVH